VGEFVTIARRSGKDWFLGSITDWTAREIEVPLEFLGKGDYLAEIYADAGDAGVNPKHTAIEEKKVNAGMRLTLKLAAGGGAAIRFRAAN
jgi:alpha-glucosidase